MYIFGGQGQFAKDSSDTYVYNLDKKTWRIISADKQIPKLDSHGAIVHKECMYVFGGYIAN